MMYCCYNKCCERDKEVKQRRTEVLFTGEQTSFKTPKKHFTYLPSIILFFITEQGSGVDSEQSRIIHLK